MDFGSSCKRWVEELDGYYHRKTRNCRQHNQLHCWFYANSWWHFVVAVMGLQQILVKNVLLNYSSLLTDVRCLSIVQKGDNSHSLMLKSQIFLGSHGKIYPCSEIVVPCKSKSEAEVVVLQVYFKTVIFAS